MGHDPVAGDLGTGQRSELAGHHDQRDPGHVADQNRPRQQIGEESQAQQSAGQADRTDQYGQHCRQRRIAATVPRCQGRQCRRGHQRGRGLRTGGEVARRSHQRVDHQRQQRRPQPRHRGQSRDGGIRHCLRNEVGRHSQAGHDIAAQPGSPVAEELRQSGRRRGQVQLAPHGSGTTTCRVRSSRAGIPLRPSRSCAYTPTA